MAWTIDGAGQPQRLDRSAIDLERRLEDWVEKDASIIADDVLIIGRQVATSHGTYIDLLGIDVRGDLVIIELKRDQTLRETVAQGIEYAAWVSHLGYEQIEHLATQHLSDDATFADTFEGQFGQTLPEALNQNQRILLVAPTITEATTDVIEYLSQRYGVPINGVSFDVYGANGQQILVRHTVVPDEAATAEATSKRRRTRTIEELRSLADDNGMLEVFERFLALRDLFPVLEPSGSAVAVKGRTPDGKSRRTAVSIYPTSETLEQAVLINVSIENFALLLNKPVSDAGQLVGRLKQLGADIPAPDFHWVDWAQIPVETIEQADAMAAEIRRFAGARP